MARPDIHLFERDLANKPGNGSSVPPRTIRAKDLDENNKKLTLLQGEGDPPSYTVDYTSVGTRLTISPILPEDADNGSLLYYDGSEWAALSPPTASGLHVLTVSGGTLSWTATEAC